MKVISIFLLISLLPFFGLVGRPPYKSNKIVYEKDGKGDDPTLCNTKSSYIKLVT
jgi:hypothetical protein